MGFMKPFKAPSLVGKNTLNSRPPPQLDDEPPSKKRRLSNDDDEGDDDDDSTAAAAKLLKKPKSIPQFKPLLQKSVKSVANSNSSNNNSSQGSHEKPSSGQEAYYTVLWYVSDLLRVSRQY